ncbi:MAG TPA: LLM class flavin-dependent oxidoreductase [Streptosporangiaceae bacterium]|jgi:alkanesulfonate monooxygenase SsuD/methylene tetrahydromethanopterin reductase-like flavin-dependent oxidoreductase (luciferase family)
MRFGIFYEHQLPRPWAPGEEERLLSEALEQVEIADRVGIDYVWEVEHHFLEEYSHSSAPEVFLAAASQRTQRIRLGHGIVQLPPAINHPARVAERIATLDLVSHGRVDFGTGEGSSAAELGGFGVVRSAKRAMWEEAFDVITRMFVEQPFAGWDGQYVRMPPREIVPKPVQRPHPPLWVACSRRETIHLAARLGIGALSFSFIEPEAAAAWVREYYEILGSADCVPAGFAVNPQVAVIVPMMMAEDEAEAIERGIDGAHFFGYSLSHFYGMRHVVGDADIWREFQERRDETGFARHIVRPDQGPLGVRLLQESLGSLRGAIGTPDQVTDLISRYEAAGVDQVIFVLQAGPNRHEHICESLELFGKRVLPRFEEGRAEREAEKADRLAPAIEAALARRAPARTLTAPYPVDEDAELIRARRRREPLRRLAADARAAMRESTQERTRVGLHRWVERVGDERVERVFGAPAVQRALFAMIARQYDPRVGGDFAGEIGYELTTSDGRVLPWTIAVRDGKARARAGRPRHPLLTLHAPVADFVRSLAGEQQVRSILEGRTRIEGDMALAYRVTEMFGGRIPY